MGPLHVFSSAGLPASDRLSFCYLSVVWEIGGAAEDDDSPVTVRIELGNGGVFCVVQ
jgi:hypothetical protein